VFVLQRREQSGSGYEGIMSKPQVKVHVQTTGQSTRCLSFAQAFTLERCLKPITVLRPRSRQTCTIVGGWHSSRQL